MSRKKLLHWDTVAAEASTLSINVSPEFTYKWQDHQQDRRKLSK